MALSPVEQFGLVSCIETSPGVSGTVWAIEEPDTVTKFGADTKDVSSEPISPDRSDRAPSAVDLDSNVEYQAELKLQEIHDHAGEMLMCKSRGGPTNVPEWSQTLANLTAIANATDITVTAGGAISLGSGGMLLLGRNWVNAANNAIFKVVAASTGTTIKSSGLTTETPAAGQGASFEICGFEAASADFSIDAQGNLTSAANILASLGLTVGQWIWIGGETSGTKFVQTVNRGLARVKAIAAGKLTLEKKSQTFTTEATPAVTIRIYFGAFYRNVSATSTDFLVQTRTFEGAYAQMAKPYSYARGNMLDQVEFTLDLVAKGEIKYMWKGFDTDTAVVSGSRKTGASTASARAMLNLMNTTTSYMRLRIAQYDETGVLTDIQKQTITIQNNVKPIKVQNNFGPKYVNYGRFKVAAKLTILMVDETVIAAARLNTQMSYDHTFRTADGGFTMDMPSVQFGGALPSFPRNEPIPLECDISAYKDPTLGFVISLSTFPNLPAS